MDRGTRRQRVAGWLIALVLAVGLWVVGFLLGRLVVNWLTGV